ncbi:hypothetical protein HU200_022431 [Digitaria exilis]|uniref:Cytochrome b5 heme-binding domain-containing protein n=1 Tax=Digitaria exilis TaxID=1010633 RepID=A0A835EYJ3_9POAL|nr:hypothetical protein HU200_022431 [Digitaria exilis]
MILPRDLRGTLTRGSDAPEIAPQPEKTRLPRLPEVRGAEPELADRQSPASGVRVKKAAAMAVAELWETLKEAIVAYTGLSPATFFTAVAVAAALYHVVSGLFAPPPPLPPRPREEPEAEPLPPPVQMGEVSEEELLKYDGSDPKKPLLMAIKGQIYDVTQSSRALAKMSFEPQDLTGDISGLGPFELDALQDWEYKFMSKYVKVGTVKKTVPVEDGNAASTAAETSETTTEAPATEEKPREVAAEEVKEKEAAADESAKES